MDTYKTIVAAQLWTKAGNKASTIPEGQFVETGGYATIKDRQCLLIVSGAYRDLYIETIDVAYVGEEEEPEPPVGIEIVDAVVRYRQNGEERSIRMIPDA